MGSLPLEPPGNPKTSIYGLIIFKNLEYLLKTNLAHDKTQFWTKELNTPCIAPQNTIWLTVASAPSVQLSHSVVSDSLWPHELQHARLPCPSPTPGTCSNSYPSSQWCHSTISSSVIPFSFCLQSFPANRVFSNESVFCIRWPKYWSFSISLINIQDWFPLGLTDLISLQSKGLKNLLQHHSSKPSIGSFLKMQNLRLNAHKMNLRLNAHKMMFTYIVIKIIIVTMMMSIYYQQSFQKPLSDV